jgi:hypothetical protein
VLVKGDGSMTSQSAMEVEGESVNNKGVVKRPRGKKHSKENRHKQQDK